MLSRLELEAKTNAKRLELDEGVVKEESELKSSRDYCSCCYYFSILVMNISTNSAWSLRPNDFKNLRQEMDGLVES